MQRFCHSLELKKRDLDHIEDAWPDYEEHYNLIGRPRYLLKRCSSSEHVFSEGKHWVNMYLEKVLDR